VCYNVFGGIGCSYFPRCSELLWEFPLGRRLNSIRSNGAHLKGESADVRRRQLDMLGFEWDPEPEPKMASKK
jgi:hypothetical protein